MKNAPRFALCLGTGLALLANGCWNLNQSPPESVSTGPGGFGGFAAPDLLTPVVHAKRAPRPVSGGTLMVLADNRTAVAADPDRDQVYLVDMPTAKVTATIALVAGDEPGRVVQDPASGHVLVALRRGGAVVTIDPVAGTVLDRRAVCVSPRGLAINGGDLIVACFDGTLVHLPVAGGAVTSSTRLDGDLRDVVVSAGVVYLTRFRTAEVLQLGANDAIVARTTLPGVTSLSLRSGEPFAAEVAWRAVAAPSGGIAVVHQRAQTSLIGAVVTPGYYAGATSSEYGSGGGAGSIVHGAVSIVPPVVTDGSQSSALVATAPALDSAVLPVDVAISSDGLRVAVAAAGNASPVAAQGNQSGSGFEGSTVQSFLYAEATSLDDVIALDQRGILFAGQPTAVAFDILDRLIVQSREPATLQIEGTPVVTIPLAGDSLADTGDIVFHGSTGEFGNIACASCHVEGGEDGHVWQFAEGARRTPDLRGGGIAARAPYHWDGSEATMQALSDDVFTTRMGGQPLTADEVSALTTWVGTVPALPPQALPIGVDSAAVARGQALFDSPSVNCGSCHNTGGGALHDVSTGGSFKAPSLRSVAWRLPVIHDGCAATLADRFTSCGGFGSHGNDASLTPAQQQDLVAYLSSL